MSYCLGNDSFKIDTLNRYKGLNILGESKKTVLKMQ